MNDVREIERYCVRFATLALTRGLITAEQLDQALAEQERSRQGKAVKSFGTICFEHGLLEAGQIETLLTEVLREA